MIHNYFKIAWRNLIKNKGYTFINVVGLAMGIWCAILTGLWVQDEYSYDDFHEHANQIYRLHRNVKHTNGVLETQIDTAYPIADALVETFPEVRDRTRYKNPIPMVIEVEKEFLKRKVAGGDSNFFKTFSFQLTEGYKEQCLSKLNSIVISSELSESYFKDASALGKTISLIIGDKPVDFSITGVFQKDHKNTTFDFDLILPIDNYLKVNTYWKSWGNSWLSTYVILDEKAHFKTVNAKIANFPKQKGKADWFTLTTQPLKEVYLHNKFKNGGVAGGRIDTIILFSIIAFFTLLIACFNFINLATAWASHRTKEIGIRKAIGGEKKGIIFQFITEALLIIIPSILIAVLLTIFSLNKFNGLTNKHIVLDLFDINFYIFLLGICCVTVLFSALYPAVYLASFKIVDALKGKLVGNNFTQALFRKGLVTFQFCLVIILTAGTLSVVHQLKYLFDKNLGFDKENIICMQIDENTIKRYNTIKSKLLQHTSILEVSAARDFMDVNYLGLSSDPKWKLKPKGNKIWFAIQDIDFGLLELLNIKLIKGRAFSPELATDTTNFVINKAAAKVMGFENPIGEHLEAWGVKGKIIGITQDFHFSSLHSAVKPIIFRCQPSNSYLAYVKIQPNKIKETLAYMEKVHKNFSEFPFDYTFLDKKIDAAYKREMVLQKLISYFTIFAIFISVLGLIGLATYTAKAKGGEIAIRKVLGAKIFNIISLLFQEYFIMILISCVIALPIAYYFTSNWLANFAYRTTLSWQLYLFPLLLIIIITIISIGYSAIKSAIRNPIKSLRTE